MSNEPFDADLYDASDVVITIKDGRKRNEVTLIARSETTINLFKFYFALAAYVDKIRVELKIMERADGEH